MQPPFSPTHPPTALPFRGNQPTKPASSTSPTKNPLALRRHLTHLSLPLRPLLRITTGDPHPSFPPTLLHFHLLTECQLDSLAEFYHQATPSACSFEYPEPVVLRWNIGADQPGSRAGIEDKRRRFGRFVGLRGCESPESDGVEGWEQVVMDRWVEDRLRRIGQRSLGKGML